MKHTPLFSLALAVAALGIAGCSDADTVDPGNTSPLMPSTVGTTWVYSVQIIDTNGVVGGTYATDSMTVVGSNLSLHGKNGFLVQVNRFNDTLNSTDTSTFSNSGGAFYQYLSDNPSGGSDNYLWMKLLDQNATGEWVMLDTTIALDFGSGPVGTVHIRSVGAKVGSESVTTPAGTFNTTHYTQTVTSNFTLTGLPIGGTSRGVTDYYHASGVGFVKIRENASTSDNDMIPKEEGRLSTLVRYSVK